MKRAVCTICQGDTLEETVEWSRPAMKTLRLALVLAPLAVAANASALTFNLFYPDGASQQARDGFAQAAARYSSRFTDPIVINLNVGTVSLPGSSILGYADSAAQEASYASVRSALRAHASTDADVQAVLGLSPLTNLPITTNYFGDSPYADRSTPFDAIVQNLSVNTANAKALGLRAADDAGQDGLIRFNSEFPFDYNPDDGITAGMFDFVGIATHEIGHALGFVSGVDDVDQLPAGTNRATQDGAFVTPLDLFRRSGVSTSVDMTANTTPKYLSLDNGVTGQGRLFSLGVSHGDGRQASHWKDNLGIGTMDPTSGRGELDIFTQNDNLAFDVMGYTPVPEPATFAALGVGALALLRRRKRA